MLALEKRLTNLLIEEIEYETNYNEEMKELIIIKIIDELKNEVEY